MFFSAILSKNVSNFRILLFEGRKTGNETKRQGNEGVSQNFRRKGKLINCRGARERGERTDSTYSETTTQRIIK